MVKKQSSNKARLKRHARVRKTVCGTPERPRLCVFRSLKNLSAQIIDDKSATTLVSASTLDKEFEGYGGNKDSAKKLGAILAKKAIDSGITTVVFDRGGYLYHGRVHEFAQGAREGGLEF